MVRSLWAGCLALVLCASACKDDKDLDDIPAPSAEQIAAAKKKAAAKKAEKVESKKGTADKATKGATSAKGSKDSDKATKGGTSAKGSKDPKRTAGKGTVAKTAGTDTAAERREKRKKRLADLKARSNERRKERLERLKKRREESAKGRSPARKTVKQPSDDKAKPAGKSPSNAQPRRAAGGDEGAAKNQGGSAASASPRAQATPVNALKIERYIALEDLKETIGKSDIRANGALVGIAPSARYNSVLFVDGKTGGFVAAVQVWKEVTQRAANRRFQTMKQDYPNVQATDVVSTKGFFSSWNDIMTLVFFEPFRRTLVAVTCSAEACSQAALVKLATRVKQQM